RVQSHLTISIVCKRPNVALVESICPDSFRYCASNFLSRVRYFHEIDFRALEHSGNVFWQPKYRRPLASIVASDSLEHSSRIMQSVSEEWNFSLGPLYETSIQPYPS